MISSIYYNYVSIHVFFVRLIRCIILVGVSTNYDDNYIYAQSNISTENISVGLKFKKLLQYNGILFEVTFRSSFSHLTDNFSRWAILSRDCEFEYHINRANLCLFHSEVTSYQTNDMNDSVESVEYIYISTSERLTKIAS